MRSLVALMLLATCLLMLAGCPKQDSGEAEQQPVPAPQDSAGKRTETPDTPAQEPAGSVDKAAAVPDGSAGPAADRDASGAQETTGAADSSAQGQQLSPPASDVPSLGASGASAGSAGSTAAGPPTVTPEQVAAAEAAIRRVVGGSGFDMSADGSRLQSEYTPDGITIEQLAQVVAIRAVELDTQEPTDAQLDGLASELLAGLRERGRQAQEERLKQEEEARQRELRKERAASGSLGPAPSVIGRWRSFMEQSGNAQVEHTDEYYVTYIFAEDGRGYIQESRDGSVVNSLAMDYEYSPDKGRMTVIPRDGSSNQIYQVQQYSANRNTLYITSLDDMVKVICSLEFEGLGTAPR